MTSQYLGPRGNDQTRISPSRLLSARLRRGMTKSELAKQLNIAPATLSRWESEGPPPSKSVALIAQLEKTLNFSPAYFSASELEIPEAESTLFRAGSRATKRQKMAAIACGTSGVILASWLRRNFNFPPPKLPDLTGFPPSEAAKYVRTIWRLGDRPIPNSVQLAESFGIAVMGLPPFASAVDAFSLWDGDQPFIFLARRRTPEGARFDLSHELGHLVMHSGFRTTDPKKDYEKPSQNMEAEANAFASEFLIPGDAVRARLRMHPSLQEILLLKSQFKVSAMAALRSAYTNGRLTEREYRTHATVLSQRGFRTGEPGSKLQYERSRIFDYVLGPDGGEDLNSISMSTSLPIDDLSFLVLNSQTVALSSQTGSIRNSQGKRPHLRLVR